MTQRTQDERQQSRRGMPTAAIWHLVSSGRVVMPLQLVPGKAAYGACTLPTPNSSLCCTCPTALRHLASWYHDRHTAGSQIAATGRRQRLLRPSCCVCNVEGNRATRGRAAAPKYRSRKQLSCRAFTAPHRRQPLKLHPQRLAAVSQHMLQPDLQLEQKQQRVVEDADGMVRVGCGMEALRRRRWR